MGTQSDDRKTTASRPPEDGKPPHGQGHQPLPGENPPRGDDTKRKHVQNADLPPGVGHQPLPGEDPPGEGKD